MIDFSSIGPQTTLGRVLRTPLRLVPDDCVMPILQGRARGFRWVAGALTHGVWLGTYERQKQEVCARLAWPGAVAYDLGANAGFYSLLLSRVVGAAGRVLAFEPAPDNLALLRRHLAMNGIDNVVVLPLAVGDTCGDVAFEIGANASLGRVVEQPTGVRVPMTTIDSLVYEHGHEVPDLLKIDVEGAESRVLRGMATVIRRARPRLLIELHGAEQACECRRFLADANYRISRPTGATTDDGEEAGTIVALPAQTH